MAQESVLRIVIDSRNAERNAHALANELESIEKKGDFATKSMDSMSVATRQLAGYMAGIVTIGAAINKIDTYTGINNKLKLITNSQEELNRAMQDTFAIAQKSASSWGAVNDVYSKYMSNAKTLNLTQEQTARLTEITSKAVAISGSNTESAAGALFQYGQALDGNILRGEEYNALVDGAGGLLSAMAKGLGITRGELRQMMLDGKLTGEVITKALLKAGDSVDELFNKTDVTIGQSLTVLSDSVTKFTGEAASGSGAATVLAGSIKGLAENLDLVANIAVVGGVAMLTKTVLAQTVAIQGSIAASAQRRAVDAAVLQSQVQLAAIEVQRTRQVTALAITEVGLARQELNSATTRQARAAATMRLTQAEIALAIAQKQTKAATVEQIAAENALNASRAIGSRMLALVGGPIGAITLGVTALAAGYMYLQDRTAEANAKLEEQGKIAEKTDEELTKLSGNDKKNAVSDLTAAFNAQNAELSKSKEAVDAVLFAIRASSVENEKARKVTEDAKNGVISYNQAIELLNKMDISPELYEMLKKTALQYDENSNKAGKTQKALKALGIEFKLSGNAAQNAVNQVDENTQALNDNETAAQRAAKAQKGFFDSLSSDVLNANENLAYLNLGFSKEVIEKIQELQKAKQAVAPSGTTAIVTTEEINQIVRAQKALDAVKDKEDEIAEAKRKQNKEGEKKLKITQAELEVAKRSAALVESSGLGKYAESKGIPSSVIAGLLAQESKGLKDAKSPTGAIGYFQTTGRYRKQNNMSVADSYDLEKSGKIAIDNIAKVYEKTGNLAQAILSYNAGEGGARQFTKTGKIKGSAERNKEVSEYVGKVSRYSDIIAGGIGKGGLSDGDSDRAYGEQIRARLELVKQGLGLQEQYESEQAKRTKDRNEEINLAQQTGQQALIPKIKERYEAQDKLAKLQQEYEAEGYKWTEERKLQYTYETNVLRLTAEGKFSEDQKKIFEKGLKDQRDQELAWIKLAKEQRIFQFEQAMYTEMDLIKKRYDLELQEAARLQDQEERVRRINAASSTKKQDESNLLWNTTINYNNAIGVDTSAVQALKTRQDAIDAMYQEGFIKQKEHEAQSIASRKKYDRDLQSSALSSLNTLLSTTSSTWSSMTQLVKDGAGEQSGAYKAMFLMQQMFSIGSALVSTHLAAAQVMADPSALTLAQKSMYSSLILGMGYANVGLIAGQTIAGMAHNGIDNIPKEGTWLLDGGERVLNPRQNEDFTRFLQEQESATKRVGVGTLDAINSGKSMGEKPAVVQPVVNIYTLPGQTADVSMNADGSLDVRIRKIAEEHVAGQLGNPNSHISKAAKQNLNVAQRR